MHESNQSGHRPMVIGILAHVDAGKTTLSERVLYEVHAIRSMGRVDHQSAFLDSDPIERERGITIFSGQAHFMLGERPVTWLDTPGHVDFSAEMERALAVMDAAVLVVSGVDGVQSHTETLWRLLDSYHVPVFLFINKLDRDCADADAMLSQLRGKLSPDILDLRCMQMRGSMDEALAEEIASRDEALLERYLEGSCDESLLTHALRRMLRERTAFAMMGGSALSGDGVAGFLRVMGLLLSDEGMPTAEDALRAQVYSVRHDAKGQRVCMLKLLSGTLRVKDELPGQIGKVNELRIFHGERYRTVDEAGAGMIVGIPGLDGLRPGDRIGQEGHEVFRTEPMMSSSLIWDSNLTPLPRLLEALRILEDEEPTLSVEEAAGRVSLHTMGAIQLEVLRQQLLSRWSYDVSFGPRRVLYRETVAAPCVGIGHYEPLRHYAEVHLRLVPTPPGSGVSFRSLCHVDDLALNWQRLIETHVFEKQHKGVLTGAPLTDVRVELLCGRDHLKHTEGGDFRQATYRALKNALMHAQSVLLEPICGYQLEIPAEYFGTVSGALLRMQAEQQPPERSGDTMTLRGEAPFALFSAWQTDLMMLTHGRGTVRVWLARYAPCRDAERIIAEAAYHPQADDTPDSVFCAHGAGFTVAWNHVRDWAHCPQEYPPVDEA